MVKIYRIPNIVKLSLKTFNGHCRKRAPENFENINSKEILSIGENLEFFVHKNLLIDNQKRESL